VDRGAGIESAGEGEADFFAGGQILKYVSHVDCLVSGFGPRNGPMLRIT
jgi:hypothetical protein